MRQRVGKMRLMVLVLVAAVALGGFNLTSAEAQTSSQAQSDQQFLLKNGHFPGPGENLPPDLLSGSELGNYNDQYLGLKRFWGDDVVSRAFENATNNTAGFLGSMWSKYGVRVDGEAPWQQHLRAAVEAGKAGNWNKTIAECNDAIANNQHALDAYLLRGVAFRKLNQNQAALTDVKSIYETRKNAQEFLNRMNGGDTVLKSTGAPTELRLHGFQDLQDSLKGK